MQPTWKIEICKLLGSDESVLASHDLKPGGRQRRYQVCSPRVGRENQVVRSMKRLFSLPRKLFTSAPFSPSSGKAHRRRGKAGKVAWHPKVQPVAQPL